MELIVNAVRRLSAFFGIVAAICLGAACIAVCHMVFVRYVLGASTIWQTEFVLYSVVAATLLGSPYVLAMGGHVNVDLVSHYLGPRARKVLRIFASTLGIVFCVVVASSGWNYYHEAWTEGWVTESVWAPPLSVIVLPLPLGLGLLVLQYIVDIACLITGYEPSDLPDAAQEPPA